MSAPLEARAVRYTIGQATLVDGVDLVVQAGELVALIGPNGAGKSTLCGLLAGDLDPTGGTVLLDGRSLREYRPAELARRRAMLPQGSRLDFPFPVREVVLMGRHPHLRRGRAPTAHDERVAEIAMHDADVAEFAARSYTTLSGGEQTRVNLARVLAQEAPVILLDEPTTALDLRHQQQVMALCRRRADRGDAVVVVLHDLALAAAWADRIGAMSRGRLVACGTPEEVLTPETVVAVFEQPVVVFSHPRHGRPIVVPDAGIRDDRGLRLVAVADDPVPKGAHT